MIPPSQSLADQLQTAQMFICLLVHKMGSPVIISQDELEGLPAGTLTVSTDEATMGTILAYDVETSGDKEPAT